KTDVLSLAADVDHGAGGGEEIGFADVVASFFLVDDGDDVGAEIVVGGATAHTAVEVVLEDGEEAGANLAVGSEADARAVSAEGLGDGGDDADLAATIFEDEAAGGFAGSALDLAHGHVGVQLREDLFEGDDDFGGPDAIFFQRHEFDKANDDI